MYGLKTIEFITSSLKQMLVPTTQGDSFLAHIGWFMCKKHSEVMKYGKTVDCSDLLADPIVFISESE